MLKESFAMPTALSAAEELVKEQKWKEEAPQRAQAEADWRAEALRKLAPRGNTPESKPVTTTEQMAMIEPDDELRESMKKPEVPVTGAESVEAKKTMYQAAVKELGAALNADVRDEERIKKARAEMTKLFVLSPRFK